MAKIRAAYRKSYSCAARPQMEFVREGIAIRESRIAPIASNSDFRPHQLQPRGLTLRPVEREGSAG